MTTGPLALSHEGIKSAGENLHHLIGSKAEGLSDLPDHVVPSFVVITTRAQVLWADRVRNGSLPAEAAREVIDYCLPELRPLLSSESRLLLRSSGVAEGLTARGTYASAECGPDLTSIIGAVEGLWSAVRASSPPLALILQKKVKSRARGHLSNERRLARRGEIWVCEFEAPPELFGTQEVFRIKTTSTAKFPSSLAANDKSSLLAKLRSVAGISHKETVRFHYEWLWTGERVWLVQRDAELIPQGPPPGEMLRLRYKESTRGIRMSVLRRPEEGDSKWPKVEAIHAFRACGLPTPELFLLSEPAEFVGSRRGPEDGPLEADFRRLIGEGPGIVVRVDLPKGYDFRRALLPRSDLLRSVGDVLVFLRSTLLALRNRGCKSRDVAFLMHRFIPSHGAALALVESGDREVSMDAMWGSPDGLLSLPHDSYLVRTSSRSVRMEIRFKPFCIDMDRDGRWIKRRLPAPWDWRPTLNSELALAISEAARSVQVFLGRSLVIRFLVNATGSKADYLPWAVLPATAESGGFARRGSQSQPVVVVRDSSDLDRLAECLFEGGPESTVELTPSLELLRDLDSIRRLAEIVNRHGSKVVLQGSLLSHIYYVLLREGVAVFGSVKEVSDDAR